MDIRQYALELLELSKKFLSEDLSLDPTAFIVTKSGEPVLRPLDFQDEEHKVDSLGKVVREAKEDGALAIITIFTAHSKEFNQVDFDEQTYSWGKLQEEGASRNILMTLSGPAMKNWVISAAFRQDGNGIEFSRPEEITEGVVMGLLPGWAAKSVQPS